MEDLNNKTILIVEDTPENIDILFELLDDYEIMVAISGEDALDTLAESEVPDLILLDIMMPGIDGYEVCRRLRADDKTKEVPVVFLTAKTEADEIQKCYDVGGQDYIPKPIDASVLFDKINKYLKN